MKKIFKISLAVSLLITSACFIGRTFIANSSPDTYHITQDPEIRLSGYLPLSVKPVKNISQVNSLSPEHFPSSFKAKLTLFDMIPIKSVRVDLIPECKVIPCGTPFGVKIFTDGVMIIGVSTVKTENGICNPAKSCGLKKGDVITKVNNNLIRNNEELANVIEKSDGKELNVSVQRGNITFDTILTPAKSCDDKLYRAGIWVRDSSAGIGTITFYNSSNNSFSGLGHGICDIDTGELLPLSHGDIMEASINGINKGRKGTPGELRGSFVDSHPIGTLNANTETGIYGTLKKSPSSNKPLNIAMKQQVKTGPAKILTTLSGEQPQFYDINIESINYNDNNPTKNILISITDKDLIQKTGGIVQGMSGSPIIQNNMLIGAVTHVFVNEPHKGYAIFAETMLTKSNNIYSVKYKNVS